MLNPSAADLLAGMADALAATVLDELAPGPARDQVQAAIGLARRLARALPHLGGYLHEDTRDLATTLRQLQATGAGPPPGAGQGAPTGGAGADGPADALADDALADDALADALARAEALPAAPPLPLDELTAVNLRLREALADVAGAAGLDAATEATVRDLLSRMTAREMGLRLSPWQR